MREVMQRRLTSLAWTGDDMIRVGMYAKAETLGTARKMCWRSSEWSCHTALKKTYFIPLVAGVIFGSELCDELLLL